MLIYDESGTLEVTVLQFIEILLYDKDASAQKKKAINYLADRICDNNKDCTESEIRKLNHTKEVLRVIREELRKSLNK